MRCISPLKASQNWAGDIVYSSNKAIPGLVGFQFDCRKCLPCRLNIAREKAVRSYHEAKMYDFNIFLTLTYNEESLDSPKLNYRDFQLFMKILRKTVPQKLNYMVTGEYGGENKRPHWHAIIFNYYPDDAEYKYTSDRGDKVWKSKKIDSIWGKGNCEFGDVTMDSAGYVARYAAKKLVHGKDEEHDYHPIHKTSSKKAIGRSWIEQNWKHTFENGFVVLPNGTTSRIPRYYSDWLKKHQPEIYNTYVTTVRQSIIEKSEKKFREEELNYISSVMSRKWGSPILLKREKVSELILRRKFKQLQERLKL